MFLLCGKPEEGSAHAPIPPPSHDGEMGDLNRASATV
jgi:hypothetical protein